MTQLEKRESRIGEKGTNTQGEEMEIISYDTYNDIEVKFSDGTTRKTTYQNFKNGLVAKHKRTDSETAKAIQILNSRKHKQKCDPAALVGKSFINSDGEQVDIIAYDPYEEYTVKFKSGRERKNITSTQIRYGGVRDVQVNKRKSTVRKRRIGEKSVNDQGLEMTIISYENVNSVIVEFADGQRNKCRYRDFVNGKVHKPGYRTEQTKQLKIGETSVSSEGEQITIIDYKGCDNITVKFADGSIRDHVRYKSFKEGTVVKNSRVYGAKYKYIGMSKTFPSGETVTIIDYINNRDITVAFSDGTLKYHVTVAQFKSSTIHKPGTPYKTGRKAKEDEKQQ